MQMLYNYDKRIKNDYKLKILLVENFSVSKFALFYKYSIFETKKYKKHSMGNTFIKSSIGKKIIMSVTGLFLITFLITHLAVNLTLFGGKELFNSAAHFMATNPMIQIMQYVLALGFIYHIVYGIKLTLENKKATPVKYAYDNRNVNSMWTSRNMIITGIIILLFLIIHLRDYFYPMKFGDMKGLTDYDLVIALFTSPIYTVIYVISFVMLGLHLNHGFQSAFQSIGVNHGKYVPMLKTIGKLYSILIAVGFSSISIYFYIKQFI